MVAKIQSLSVVRIIKGVLGFLIIGFSFIQCSDPLSFLLDDTTLSVNKDKLLVYEGETGTIGFRLNAKLFDEGKSVTLTASFKCDGMSESEKNFRATMDKSTMTWTSSNWATWQNFVFVAPDNAKQEATMRCQCILEPIQSNDAGFDGFKMKSIPVTVLDNDGDANIKLSTQSLALAEAGNVSYTIHLTNRPRDEVMINIIHKNDLPSWFSLPELTVSGISATSATFTKKNYNQPQTITVSFPEDAHADGNFMHALQHSVTSADPVYKNVTTINLPEVTLDLKDNDTLNFQTVNRSGTLIHSLEGREGATASFAIKPSVTLRSGTRIKLEVVAADTTRIQLLGPNGYNINPVRLTFTNSHPQVINVQFIDDITMTAASLLATTITYSVVTGGSDAPVVDDVILSPQGGFASAGGSLPIMIIDNVPEISVTGCFVTGAGTNTITEGGSVTCNIKLGASIASGGGDVVVSASGDSFIKITSTISTNPLISLMFTPANWNMAKQVTISSIDNDINETDYVGTATFTASQTGQSVSYNGKTKQVSLSIIDDDTDSFSGSPSVLGQAINVVSSIAEGGNGTFDVCLTADPRNSVTPATPATVSFTLVSSDPNVLSITDHEFSRSTKGCHTFTLEVPDNSIADGTRSVTLSVSNFSNGGDADYTLTKLSSVMGNNIAVSITDDEIPSVTISASALTVEEGGLAETYTISLAANALPPSGENVVINLSTNHALLTVAPPRLTLDSINSLKTVTVTRVNNDIDEDDSLTGTISHTLDISTGASYYIDSVRDTIDNANITVTMNDDDTAGFVFTPPNREVNVAEGRSANYTVKLSSEPTQDVTLNVNPTPGLTSSIASLTFTHLNWNTTQTVTITAGDNNYLGDYTALVNHAVSSTDSKYSSIALGQVTVNVTDNDGGTGNVVISRNILIFDDTDGATGDTYTISLSHDPAPGKTVRVSLRLSGGTNTLQVNPAVVNFTNKTGQTITVKRASGASGMIIANIAGAISHTIETGTGYEPNITTFANSVGSTVNVTVKSTVPMVDADHDGLIDIDTAEKLNNMRYNLAGTSYKTSGGATVTGDSSGCPASGCHGYELMVDIDLESLLDKNGNGMIDTTDVIVAGKTHTVIDIGTGKDTSWMPIGDNSTGDNTTRFTGNFEGNNHTIANLWVHTEGYAGLFGMTDGTMTISNVGIISGSIHSSSSSDSYSGGLVGYASSTITITNSYFSGGERVSSSSNFGNSFSYSGGLVGYALSTITITNSYLSDGTGVSSSANSFSSYSFSGGLVGATFASSTITNSYFSGGGAVSSSSSSSSYSGGLVGSAFTSSTITNSYFSGGGKISSSSSSSSSSSYSGGLVGSVGNVTLTITNSYFSGGGKISSSSSSYSYSGGLVGSSRNTVTLTNSYWNTNTPQSVNGIPQSPKRVRGHAMGASDGLTLPELQALSDTTSMGITTSSYPSDLPHSATDSTKAWNLGTSSQLPAIKLCVNPTIVPPTTTGGDIMVTCASYGALLAGQR